MSLRQLFSSIQPKLNIIFEEQKDVSITTTIVVPVSSSFMSSPFLSQQFQQNFELFIRSFFEKLFLSETVESVVESRSDFKEEITTEINPDETQFSEVLEKGNVHLKFSGQTRTLLRNLINYNDQMHISTFLSKQNKMEAAQYLRSLLRLLTNQDQNFTN